MVDRLRVVRRLYLVVAVVRGKQMLGFQTIYMRRRVEIVATQIDLAGA
jgi:hypothetical protein